MSDKAVVRPAQARSPKLGADAGEAQVRAATQPTQAAQSIWPPLPGHTEPEKDGPGRAGPVGIAANQFARPIPPRRDSKVKGRPSARSAGLVSPNNPKGKGGPYTQNAGLPSPTNPKAKGRPYARSAGLTLPSEPSRKGGPYTQSAGLTSPRGPRGKGKGARWDAPSPREIRVIEERQMRDQLEKRLGPVVNAFLREMTTSVLRQVTPDRSTAPFPSLGKGNAPRRRTSVSPVVDKDGYQPVPRRRSFRSWASQPGGREQQTSRYQPLDEAHLIRSVTPPKERRRGPRPALSPFTSKQKRAATARGTRVTPDRSHWEGWTAPVANLARRAAAAPKGREARGKSRETPGPLGPSPAPGASATARRGGAPPPTLLPTSLRGRKGGTAEEVQDEKRPPDRDPLKGSSPTNDGGPSPTQNDNCESVREEIKERARNEKRPALSSPQTIGPQGLKQEPPERLPQPDEAVREQTVWEQLTQQLRDEAWGKLTRSQAEGLDFLIDDIGTKRRKGHQALWAEWPSGAPSPPFSPKGPEDQDEKRPTPRRAAGPGYTEPTGKGGEDRVSYPPQIPLRQVLSPDHGDSPPILLSRDGLGDLLRHIHFEIQRLRDGEVGPAPGRPDPFLHRFRSDLLDRLFQEFFELIKDPEEEDDLGLPVWEPSSNSAGRIQVLPGGLRPPAVSGRTSQVSSSRFSAARANPGTVPDPTPKSQGAPRKKAKSKTKRERRGGNDTLTPEASLLQNRFPLTSVPEGKQAPPLWNPQRGHQSPHKQPGETGFGAFGGTLTPRSGSPTGSAGASPRHSQCRIPALTKGVGSGGEEAPPSDIECPRSAEAPPSDIECPGSTGASLSESGLDPVKGPPTHPSPQTGPTGTPFSGGPQVGQNQGGTDLCGPTEARKGNHEADCVVYEFTRQTTLITLAKDWDPKGGVSKLSPEEYDKTVAATRQKSLLSLFWRITQALDKAGLGHGGEPGAPVQRLGVLAETDGEAEYRVRENNTDRTQPFFEDVLYPETSPPESVGNLKINSDEGSQKRDPPSRVMSNPTGYSLTAEGTLMHFLLACAQGRGEAPHVIRKDPPLDRQIPVLDLTTVDPFEKEGDQRHPGTTQEQIYQTRKERFEHYARTGYSFEGFSEFTRELRTSPRGETPDGRPRFSKIMQEAYLKGVHKGLQSVGSGSKSRRQKQKKLRPLMVILAFEEEIAIMSKMNYSALWKVHFSEIKDQVFRHMPPLRPPQLQTNQRLDMCERGVEAKEGKTDARGNANLLPLHSSNSKADRGVDDDPPSGCRSPLPAVTRTPTRRTTIRPPVQDTPDGTADRGCTQRTYYPNSDFSHELEKKVQATQRVCDFLHEFEKEVQEAGLEPIKVGSTWRTESTQTAIQEESTEDLRETCTPVEGSGTQGVWSPNKDDTGKGSDNCEQGTEPDADDHQRSSEPGSHDLNKRVTTSCSGSAPYRRALPRTLHCGGNHSIDDHKVYDILTSGKNIDVVSDTARTWCHHCQKTHLESHCARDRETSSKSHHNHAREVRLCPDHLGRLRDRKASEAPCGAWAEPNEPSRLRKEILDVRQRDVGGITRLRVQTEVKAYRPHADSVGFKSAFKRAVAALETAGMSMDPCQKGPGSGDMLSLPGPTRKFPRDLVSEGTTGKLGADIERVRSRLKPVRVAHPASYPHESDGDSLLETASSTDHRSDIRDSLLTREEKCEGQTCKPVTDKKEWEDSHHWSCECPKCKRRDSRIRGKILRSSRGKGASADELPKRAIESGTQEICSTGYRSYGVAGATGISGGGSEPKASPTPERRPHRLSEPRSFQLREGKRGVPITLNRNGLMVFFRRVHLEMQCRRACLRHQRTPDLIPGTRPWNERWNEEHFQVLFDTLGGSGSDSNSRDFLEELDFDSSPSDPPEELDSDPSPSDLSEELGSDSSLIDCFEGLSFDPKRENGSEASPVPERWPDEQRMFQPHEGKGGGSITLSLNLMIVFTRHVHMEMQYRRHETPGLTGWYRHWGESWNEEHFQALFNILEAAPGSDLNPRDPSEEPDSDSSPSDFSEEPGFDPSPSDCFGGLGLDSSSTHSPLVGSQANEHVFPRCRIGQACQGNNLASSKLCNASTPAPSTRPQAGEMTCFGHPLAPERELRGLEEPDSDSSPSDFSEGLGSDYSLSDQEPPPKKARNEFFREVLVIGEIDSKGFWMPPHYKTIRSSTEFKNEYRGYPREEASTPQPLTLDCRDYPDTARIEGDAPIDGTLFRGVFIVGARPLIPEFGPSKEESSRETLVGEETDSNGFWMPPYHRTLRSELDGSPLLSPRASSRGLPDRSPPVFPIYKERGWGGRVSPQETAAASLDEDSSEEAAESWDHPFARLHSTSRGPRGPMNHVGANSNCLYVRPVPEREPSTEAQNYGTRKVPEQNRVPTFAGRRIPGAFRPIRSSRERAPPKLEREAYRTYRAPNDTSPCGKGDPSPAERDEGTPFDLRQTEVMNALWMLAPHLDEGTIAPAFSASLLEPLAEMAPPPTEGPEEGAQQAQPTGCCALETGPSLPCAKRARRAEKRKRHDSTTEAGPINRNSLRRETPPGSSKSDRTPVGEQETLKKGFLFGKRPWHMQVGAQGGPLRSPSTLYRTGPMASPSPSREYSPLFPEDADVSPAPEDCEPLGCTSPESKLRAQISDLLRPALDDMKGTDAVWVGTVRSLIEKYEEEDFKLIREKYREHGIPDIPQPERSRHFMTSMCVKCIERGHLDVPGVRLKMADLLTLDTLEVIQAQEVRDREFLNEHFGDGTFPTGRAGGELPPLTDAALEKGMDRLLARAFVSLKFREAGLSGIIPFRKDRQVTTHLAPDSEEKGKKGPPPCASHGLANPPLPDSKRELVREATGEAIPPLENPLRRFPPLPAKTRMPVGVVKRGSDRTVPPLGGILPSGVLPLPTRTTSQPPVGGPLRVVKVGLEAFPIPPQPGVYTANRSMHTLAGPLPIGLEIDMRARQIWDTMGCSLKRRLNEPGASEFVGDLTPAEHCIIVKFFASLMKDEDMQKVATRITNSPAWERCEPSRTQDITDNGQARNEANVYGHPADVALNRILLERVETYCSLGFAGLSEDEKILARKLFNEIHANYFESALEDRLAILRLTFIVIRLSYSPQFKEDSDLQYPAGGDNPSWYGITEGREIVPTVWVVRDLLCLQEGFNNNQNILPQNGTGKWCTPGPEDLGPVEGTLGGFPPPDPVEGHLGGEDFHPIFSPEAMFPPGGPPFGPAGQSQARMYRAGDEGETHLPLSETPEPGEAPDNFDFRRDSLEGIHRADSFPLGTVPPPADPEYEGQVHAALEDLLRDAPAASLTRPLITAKRITFMISTDRAYRRDLLDGALWPLSGQWRARQFREAIFQHIQEQPSDLVDGFLEEERLIAINSSIARTTDPLLQKRRAAESQGCTSPVTPEGNEREEIALRRLLADFRPEDICGKVVWEIRKGWTALTCWKFRDDVLKCVHPPRTSAERNQRFFQIVSNSALTTRPKNLDQFVKEWAAFRADASVHDRQEWVPPEHPSPEAGVVRPKRGEVAVFEGMGRRRATPLIGVLKWALQGGHGPMPTEAAPFRNGASAPDGPVFRLLDRRGGNSPDPQDNLSGPPLVLTPFAGPAMRQRDAARSRRADRPRIPRPIIPSPPIREKMRAGLRALDLGLETELLAQQAWAVREVALTEYDSHFVRDRRRYLRYPRSREDFDRMFRESFREIIIPERPEIDSYFSLHWNGHMARARGSWDGEETPPCESRGNPDGTEFRSLGFFVLGRTDGGPPPFYMIGDAIALTEGPPMFRIPCERNGIRVAQGTCSIRAGHCPPYATRGMTNPFAPPPLDGPPFGGGPQGTGANYPVNGPFGPAPRGGGPIPFQMSCARAPTQGTGTGFTRTDGIIGDWGAPVLVPAGNVETPFLQGNNLNGPYAQGPSAMYALPKLVPTGPPALGDCNITGIKVPEVVVSPFRTLSRATETTPFDDPDTAWEVFVPRSRRGHEMASDAEDCTGDQNPLPETTPCQKHDPPLPEPTRLEGVPRHAPRQTLPLPKSKGRGGPEKNKKRLAQESRLTQALKSAKKAIDLPEAASWKRVASKTSPLAPLLGWGHFPPIKKREGHTRKRTLADAFLRKAYAEGPADDVSFERLVTEARKLQWFPEEPGGEDQGGVKPNVRDTLYTLLGLHEGEGQEGIALLNSRLQAAAVGVPIDEGPACRCCECSGLRFLENLVDYTGSPSRASATQLARVGWYCRLAQYRRRSCPAGIEYERSRPPQLIWSRECHPDLAGVRSSCPSHCKACFEAKTLLQAAKDRQPGEGRFCNCQLCDESTRYNWLFRQKMRQEGILLGEGSDFGPTREWMGHEGRVALEILEGVLRNMMRRSFGCRLAPRGMWKTSPQDQIVIVLPQEAWVPDPEWSHQSSWRDIDGLPPVDNSNPALQEIRDGVFRIIQPLLHPQERSDPRVKFEDIVSEQGSALWRRGKDGVPRFSLEWDFRNPGQEWAKRIMNRLPETLPVHGKGFTRCEERLATAQSMRLFSHAITRRVFGIDQPEAELIVAIRNSLEGLPMPDIAAASLHAPPTEAQGKRLLNGACVCYWCCRLQYIATLSKGRRPNRGQPYTLKLLRKGLGRALALRNPCENFQRENHIRPRKSLECHIDLIGSDPLCKCTGCDRLREQISGGGPQCECAFCSGDSPDLEASVIPFPDPENGDSEVERLVLQMMQSFASRRTRRWIQCRKVITTSPWPLEGEPVADDFWPTTGPATWQRRGRFTKALPLAEEPFHASKTRIEAHALLTFAMPSEDGVTDTPGKPGLACLPNQKRGDNVPFGWTTPKEQLRWELTYGLDYLGARASQNLTSKGEPNEDSDWAATSPKTTFLKVIQHCAPMISTLLGPIGPPGPIRYESSFDYWSRSSHEGRLDARERERMLLYVLFGLHRPAGAVLRDFLRAEKRGSDSDCSCCECGRYRYLRDLPRVPGVVQEARDAILKYLARRPNCPRLKGSTEDIHVLSCHPDYVGADHLCRCLPCCTLRSSPEVKFPHQEKCTQDGGEVPRERGWCVVECALRPKTLCDCVFCRGAIHIDEFNKSPNPLPKTRGTVTEHGIFGILKWSARNRTARRAACKRTRESRRYESGQMERPGSRSETPKECASTEFRFWNLQIPTFEGDRPHGWGRTGKDQDDLYKVIVFPRSVERTGQYLNLTFGQLLEILRESLPVFQALEVGKQEQDADASDESIEPTDAGTETRSRAATSSEQSMKRMRPPSAPPNEAGAESGPSAKLSTLPPAWVATAPGPPKQTFHRKGGGGPREATLATKGVGVPLIPRINWDGAQKKPGKTEREPDRLGISQPDGLALIPGNKPLCERAQELRLQVHERAKPHDIGSLPEIVKARRKSTQLLGCPAPKGPDRHATKQGREEIIFPGPLSPDGSWAPDPSITEQEELTCAEVTKPAGPLTKWLQDTIAQKVTSCWNPFRLPPGLSPPAPPWETQNDERTPLTESTFVPDDTEEPCAPPMEASQGSFRSFRQVTDCAANALCEEGGQNRLGSVEPIRNSGQVETPGRRRPPRWGRDRTLPRSGSDTFSITDCAISIRAVRKLDRLIRAWKRREQAKERPSGYQARISIEPLWNLRHTWLLECDPTYQQMTRENPMRYPRCSESRDIEFRLMIMMLLHEKPTWEHRREITRWNSEVDDLQARFEIGWELHEFLVRRSAEPWRKDQEIPPRCPLPEYLPIGGGFNCSPAETRERLSKDPPKVQEENRPNNERECDPGAPFGRIPRWGSPAPGFTPYPPKGALPLIEQREAPQTSLHTLLEGRASQGTQSTTLSLLAKIQQCEQDRSESVEDMHLSPDVVYAMARGVPAACPLQGLEGAEGEELPSSSSSTPQYLTRHHLREDLLPKIEREDLLPKRRQPVFPITLADQITTFGSESQGFSPVAWYSQSNRGQGRFSMFRNSSHPDLDLGVPDAPQLRSESCAVASSASSGQRDPEPPGGSVTSPATRSSTLVLKERIKTLSLDEPTRSGKTTRSWVTAQTERLGTPPAPHHCGEHHSHSDHRLYDVIAAVATATSLTAPRVGSCPHCPYQHLVVMVGHRGKDGAKHDLHLCPSYLSRIRPRRTCPCLVWAGANQPSGLFRELLKQMCQAGGEVRAANRLTQEVDKLWACAEEAGLAQALKDAKVNGLALLTRPAGERISHDGRFPQLQDILTQSGAPTLTDGNRAWRVQEAVRARGELACREAATETILQAFDMRSTQGEDAGGTSWIGALVQECQPFLTGTPHTRSKAGVTSAGATCPDLGQLFTDDLLKSQHQKRSGTPKTSRKRGRDEAWQREPASDSSFNLLDDPGDPRQGTAPLRATTKAKQLVPQEPPDPGGVRGTERQKQNWGQWYWQPAPSMYRLRRHLALDEREHIEADLSAIPASLESEAERDLAHEGLAVLLHGGLESWSFWDASLHVFGWVQMVLLHPTGEGTDPRINKCGWIRFKDPEFNRDTITDLDRNAMLYITDFCPISDQELGMVELEQACHYDDLRRRGLDRIPQQESEEKQARNGVRRTPSPSRKETLFGKVPRRAPTQGSPGKRKTRAISGMALAASLLFLLIHSAAAFLPNTVWIALAILSGGIWTVTHTHAYLTRKRPEGAAGGAYRPTRTESEQSTHAGQQIGPGWRPCPDDPAGNYIWLMINGVVSAVLIDTGCRTGRGCSGNNLVNNKFCQFASIPVQIDTIRTESTSFGTPFAKSQEYRLAICEFVPYFCGYEVVEGRDGEEPSLRWVKFTEKVTIPGGKPIGAGRQVVSDDCWHNMRTGAPFLTIDAKKRAEVPCHPESCIAQVVPWLFKTDSVVLGLSTIQRIGLLIGHETLNEKLATFKMMRLVSQETRRVMSLHTPRLPINIRNCPYEDVIKAWTRPADLRSVGAQTARLSPCPQTNPLQAPLFGTDPLKGKPQDLRERCLHPSWRHTPDERDGPTNLWYQELLNFLLLRETDTESTDSPSGRPTRRKSSPTGLTKTRLQRQIWNLLFVGLILLTFNKGGEGFRTTASFR